MQNRRRIRHGEIAYVHSGIPCSTFSILRRLSVGTRSTENPARNGARADEREANKLLEVVAELCWELQVRGPYCSIENPASSLLWPMCSVQTLYEVSGSICFDQCEYGLTPRGVDVASPGSLSEARQAVVESFGVAGPRAPLYKISRALPVNGVGQNRR